MNKTKLLKGAGLVALTAMLPLSQAAAEGNWEISGWINEGLTHYSDGGSDSDSSDGTGIIQNSQNGHTLGSRITLSGSTDLPNSGLTAGFEVILEPSDTANLLGTGSKTGFVDTQNGHDIGVLGNSINIGGSFGKVTVGLQSMPTDNIAVLEDPSLTLWSSISPIFIGNGAIIRGLDLEKASNVTWGSFIQCMGIAVGIGIDCNGIYRSGVRYDLPAFGPVTVAVGYANDNIYDVAAKYKGGLAGINTQLAVGYAINQSGKGGSLYGGTEASTFQVQGGLMDPGTGLFGSMAYQREECDDCQNYGAKLLTSRNGGKVQDETTAWWMKAGIKKAFNSLGDTSLAFQYGQYSDQYGHGNRRAEELRGRPALRNPGITSSKVKRTGFEVNQYFGSRLIIYGSYETLNLSVDCGNADCTRIYKDAKDLNTFSLGGVFFF